MKSKSLLNKYFNAIALGFIITGVIAHWGADIELARSFVALGLGTFVLNNSIK
jgi:hypothetical protein